jgi:hypothetical protein
MVYNTQNYWVFEHFPSSGILNSLQKFESKNMFKLYKESDLIIRNAVGYRSQSQVLRDRFIISLYRFRSWLFGLRSTDGASGEQ